MEMLREMLAFVSIGVAIALGGMLVVRRFVRLATLEAHTESAGFVYAALSVAYAVLLTFVVVAVWEQFRDARGTADEEATTVAALFHLADAFNPAFRLDLQQSLAGYTDTVIDEEWDQLASGRGSDRAWTISDRLWQLYTTMPQEERARAEFSRSLDEMSRFHLLRNQRILESRDTIPPVIWAVLLLGAVITIAFTYLFGVRRLAAQMVMTAALTIMIVSSLFLIYVLDNPFKGNVRIEPDAFREYQAFFNRRLTQ